MADTAKKLIKPSIDASVSKRQWTAIVQGRLIEVFADNQADANKLIAAEVAKLKKPDAIDNQESDTQNKSN